MSDEKTKHGGKRKNAGRKATGVTETKVVRVDALLVSSVNEMKDTFKETGIVPCVTFNQDDLKESYEARLELLQDSHNLAIAKLKAKPLQQQPVFELTQDIEQELNTQIKLLQTENEGLKSRVDCLELRLKEVQQLLIPNKVYAYSNGQWIAEIAYDSKSGFYYRREKLTGKKPFCSWSELIGVDITLSDDSKQLYFQPITETRAYELNQTGKKYIHRNK